MSAEFCFGKHSCLCQNLTHAHTPTHTPTHSSKPIAHRGLATGKYATGLCLLSRDATFLEIRDISIRTTQDHTHIYKSGAPTIDRLAKMLENSLEKAVIEGIQLGARVVNSPDDEKVEKLQLVDDYKRQWQPVKPKAVHKSGTFVAPATGSYRFSTTGDLSHVLAIDTGLGEAVKAGYTHGEDQVAAFTEGQLVRIELAYWATEGDLSVNIDLMELKVPPKSTFLTYRIGHGGFGAISSNRLGEVRLTPSVPYAPSKQRWAYHAATGQLENAEGRKKCLTLGNLTDAKSVTRTPLVVVDCSDAKDQHWTWVSPDSGKELVGSFTQGTLKHTQTQQCIRGELRDQGAELALGACPDIDSSGTSLSGGYTCDLFDLFASSAFYINRQIINIHRYTPFIFQSFRFRKCCSLCNVDKTHPHMNTLKQRKP